MPERINPQTSLDAYHSLKASKVKEDYGKILSALRVIKSGNSEAIAKQAKMNNDEVWKRLSEMERFEMIYKPGSKSVMKSGRFGFDWAIRGDATEITPPENHYTGKQQSAGTIASNLIYMTQLNLFSK